MKKLIYSAAIFLCVFTNAMANPSYTADDIMKIKRVSKVVPSFDGKQTAFTIIEASHTSSGKEWFYSLFVKDEKGKINFLLKNRNIYYFVWSPNAKKIAYLAKGKEFKSIWILDVNSRHTEKWLELNRDIESFKWSPDGQYLAFTAGTEKEDNKKVLKPIDVSKDFRNSRLYLVAMNTKKMTPLTSADYHVPQFYDTPSFDWAPDSKTIAYAYQPQAGALYVNQNKIGIVQIANQQVENIPFTNTRPGIQPVYSPDGRWIAFRTTRESVKIATDLNDDINLQGRICTFNVTSKQTHCLANTMNENPALLGWDQQSKNVIVFDEYKSIGFQVYTLNLDTNIPAKNISNLDGFIEPLTINLNQAGTTLGFGYETPSHAPEVFVSSLNSFQLNQITHLQNKEPNLGKTEVIHWKSVDGLEIEGLLMTPANYDAKKKYPVYVDVHGGPAGNWGKRYLGACEDYDAGTVPTSCWGNLLSMGFVVFAPNPRGSEGFGPAFTLGNFADLGGKDYQDIMTGIDALIAKGIADQNHLAIAGWSFGGYMTAWALTQTNRFKVAIEGDGNTNMISFSGTTDIPKYYINYLGSPFWEDSKLYLARAPITFTKNIKTPLLIITGENDIRVPTAQSYELYSALKMQNKTVKMLVLPEQGHVPDDANVIYETIKEIDEWVKQGL